MQKNSKKIKLFQPFFNSEEKKNIANVLDSGWVTNGPITQKFEKEIKKFTHSKNAIAVNSCTNGIIAVIKALDLRPGDEVLTSPMTFVSVIHALEILKLKVKLVDINYENFSLDYYSIKKNLSKKTKLIVITHYGGTPVDINKIVNLCKKKKIHLIEDAATSFGSKIGNKMTGSSKYSTSVFSFYANKIITTGEGGVITCFDNKLASKIRSIISCGIDKDPWKRYSQKNKWFYNVKFLGFKFNFTDIQAALGLAQLKKLKNIISHRKKIRKIYDHSLSTLFKNKILFKYQVKKNIYSSEYIYTIFLNTKTKLLMRDKLINYLEKNNIFTTVHYIPANYHEFYKKKFKKYKVSNSDFFFKNVISLPFHNKLSKKDVIKITDIIKKFFKNEKIL